MTREITERDRRAPGGMSGRTAAWLAWSLCASVLTVLALSLLLLYVAPATSLPRGYSRPEQLIFVTGLFGAPILGGLIASRRSESAYGWVWLGFGLSFALLYLGQSYAVYAVLAVPGSLPAPRTVATVLGEGFAVGITLWVFLLLLFPDGRLPSRQWRFVAWVVAIAGIVLVVLGLFRPGKGVAPVENPLGLQGGAGEVIVAITDAGVYIVLVGIILSALSLVFRYRHAVGIERQQIKWFTYAAVFLGGTIPAGFFIPNSILSSLLNTVSFLSLYVAVGIAVFRYRLYDIDLIINRTLVYGSLTAMLVLVYFGGVISLQYAFRALSEQGSQLAVVASTLAIAALFSPLRRRVQAFIDRRFYRRKYDAQKTLEDFSARLRNETDLDRLGDDLLRVVGETMQPAHAGLWLRPDTTSKEDGGVET